MRTSHLIFFFTATSRQLLDARSTTNERFLIPAFSRDDDGVLVMLVGGARTILCIFPRIVEEFLKPLDPTRGGADLGALLKYKDPGPKGQDGR